MSTQPVSLHKYSLNWARGIVEQVERKYPRGTELLCDILSIDKEVLARFLANGDPLWPFLRQLAQFLQAYFKNPAYKPNLPAIKQDVRQWAQKRGKERILLRLDELGIFDEP